MNETGAPSVAIRLPDVWAVREKRFDNVIRQIGWRGKQLTGSVSTVSLGRSVRPVFKPSNGELPVLIVKSASKALPSEFECILAADVDENLTSFDPSKARWLRHPALPTPALDPEALVASVVSSWKGAFSFVQEDPATNTVGLRSPQLGALHMIIGHWSATDNPATIVLPTGTGKTDTMIAVLVAVACSRVLVLVPSDTLREQLTQKFLDLGVLSNPNSAVLQPGAMRPVVAALEHIPRNRAEVESIFKAANVIVTTSNIPASSSEDVQKAMSELCSHLFIDEAHHAEAPTWRAFKDVFRRNRILQFTATPFREDGHPLDGKIIYNYTLRRAQQDGYFKPITFAAVTDFNPGTSDRTIAKRAVEALIANPKHIAMARVSDVKRAREVFEVYKEFPQFNPVELHVGVKSASDRRKIRQQIVSGQSRIVVCVDMLGEGFDLPELKIAAFHDIRKTLAVTLQLAGRFIRTRADLGNATFIANTALVDVQDELRNLYMRDPDWNQLLPQLIENAIGRQQSLQDFLSGFTEFAPEFPIAGVQPALSTVVYKTKCTDWTPARFRDGIPNMATCAQIHHSLNPLAHTLLIVTAQRKQLQWVKGDAVHDWEWELFVVYWWKDKNLLFINGSANAGNYLTLAEAMAGESVELIKGQTVFRSFDGITRLQLQNVGLSEQLGRNVRYTGRMGASVGTALTDLQKRKATKSVLAGAGYFNGYKMGIGASRKGRIWTHRRDNLDEFTKWCRDIGTKLIDDNIDEDEILGGTLVPEEITTRPSKYPIAIDWPEVIFLENESYWSVAWGGKSRALSDISMTLIAPSLDGPLRFALETEDGRLEGEIEILVDRPGYQFDFSESNATIGGGRRGASTPLATFFYEHPPQIWFADGASLEGNELIELKSGTAPYDRQKIVAYDWTGTDLQKESQGPSRNPASIQARIIRDTCASSAEIVFDDDGAGEAADVVTIRVKGGDHDPSQIDLEFYHCKWSQDPKPGARIDDLYVVCGQAQKSIVWMTSAAKSTDLFTHLLRRDAVAIASGRYTRFEKGDVARLEVIREMSRRVPISLKIHIVQPGVSKAKISVAQLELLSVTENHLRETFQLSFGAIMSP